MNLPECSLISIIVLPDKLTLTFFLYQQLETPEQNKPLFQID